ncbi:MAG: ABC transporter substrate-binding protein [Chloroflexi bacterium]|nr:ABC transporter substrate-binding protein [Chloroflexota bacterium]
MKWTKLALIAVLVLTLVLGVAATGAQDDSRTVVDALGREVTLDGAPERVVGMSASITEMLFAIGVEPVGATEGIEYPEGMDELPTFGTGYQPNLEALAELEPDLIIANAQLQAPLVGQLEAIAPTVFVLTLVAADIPANVRLIGEITWSDESATALADDYDAFLEQVSDAASEMDGPSILIIVGTLDVPNYGKSTTYLGDMAVMLGATNIADGEEDAGPFPGYTQLDIERILEEDPDVILTVTRGAPGTPPMPETMSEDPLWSALTAVQEGRVFELDNRLYLEAPGPRFTEAFEGLYTIFYDEEFELMDDMEAMEEEMEMEEEEAAAE